LHLVGILFTHINDDAGQNRIKNIVIIGFKQFEISLIYKISILYRRSMPCSISDV